MRSIASFFLAPVVFSSYDNGILGRIVHGSVMRSIGVWSYSIYMVHAFIISVVATFSKQILRIDPSELHGLSSILANCLLLVATIVVSRITYVFIEDKYRRVIKAKLRRNNTYMTASVNRQ